MVVEVEAIGYARRSSRKQKENHSIDFQKQQIEIQANRMGYTIVDWCIDDAVSAYRNPANKRDGLRKLFDLVVNDKATAVFFYDESRIDRSIVTFVNEIYKPLLQAKPNIKFFSTTSIDEWNPYQIDIQFKLLNASYESLSKSQRTKDTQKSLMKQNKRPGSRTPFGLKKVPAKNGASETFVEDDNASIVRLIYYLYMWGYSIKHIAEILDESSAPAPGGKGWHKNTVEAILKRPIYLGDNVWGIKSETPNNLFENKAVYADPIISWELHELVNQARELERKFGQFSTPYTFRSISQCMKCNIDLVTKDFTPGKAKRKYRSYYCPGCKQKAEIEDIHSTIFQCFSTQWAPAIKQMERFGKIKLTEMKKELERELKSINSKEELLKYNEGMIPSMGLSSSIIAHYEEVKSRVQEKRRQLVSTLDQVTNLLNKDGALYLTLHLSLSSSFEKLTDIEKRMIALTFIEKVVINLEQKKVNIDFRLHPFIELESKVGYLTELNQVKMDA
ncbi:recombinase family protein [Sutcliffiella horikoshii]|uniref:recombinase family protein n=1 Tax=Sutcliffiella horikoshii TaxID=79883 RepID=UPI003CEB8BF0